jgi:TP901 family phage tail tape measure protein
MKLIDAVTAPIQKLQSKMDTVSGAAQKMVSGTSAIGKAADPIGKVSKALDETKLAGNKVIDTTKTLGSVMGAASSIVSNGFNHSASSAFHFADTIGTATSKIKDLGVQAEKATDVTAKGLDKAAKSLNDLNSKYGNMAKVGGVMSAMGAGMTAAAALPIKSAIDKQAAMTALKMPTMRQDGSNPIWDAIEPTLKTLGGQTSKGSMGVSEIAAGLIAEGVKPDAINSGTLESALKLSFVGKTDNRATGELLAKLAGSAGTDDYNALADLVARTGHGANMSFDTVLGQLTGMNKAGEGLGMTGMGATQTFAKIITGMSISGIDGTQIGSAMEGLIKDIPQLGERFKHGKGWRNVEAAGIQKKYGLGDFTGQLFDESGSLRGETGEEKLDNVLQLFDIINTKVTSAQDKQVLFKELLGESAIATASKLDFGNLNEAAAKMREQADITKKFDEAQNDSAEKWAKLRSAAGGFLSAAGKPLLDTTSNLLEKLTGITQSVSKWMGAHPKLTGAIVGTVGALGGLLTVGGGAIATFGFVGKSLESAGKFLPVFKSGILGATKSVWAFTSSLLANPITWIALAAVAAGVLIYKYWEPIKKFFSGLWDWFVGQGPAVDAAIAVMFPIIGIPMLIVKHWDTIKGYFTRFWAWFEEQGAAVDVIVGILCPLIGIPMLIAKYWDELKAIWKGFTETFMSEAPRLAPELEQFWVMVKDIAKSFGELWESVCDIFSPLGELFALLSPNGEGVKGVESTSKSAKDLGGAFNIGKMAADFLIGKLKQLLKMLEAIAATIRTVMALFENLATLISTPNRMLGGAIKGFGKEKGFWKSVGNAFGGAKDEFVDTGGKLSQPWKKVGDSWGKVFSPVKVAPQSVKSLQDQWSKEKALRGEAPLSDEEKEKRYALLQAARMWEEEHGKPDEAPKELGSETKAKAAKDAVQKPDTQAAGTEALRNWGKSDGKTTQSGNVVTIHYEPKLEFKGAVKEDDKDYFRRQLESHRDDIARLVSEVSAGRQSWQSAR